MKVKVCWKSEGPAELVPNLASWRQAGFGAYPQNRPTTKPNLRPACQFRAAPMSGLSNDCGAGGIGGGFGGGVDRT